MRFEAGEMLLHYRMVEQIGQGGMGVVWRAVDTTLDREVAIKLLPQEFAADSNRLGRFQREAKVLASLNHPGVASIYSVHEAEGVRFLAMELVHGDVLSRHIPEGGASLETLLDVAGPLANAVAQAHQRGITHRDLKPDNVMITTEGRVKVLDFGLAKSLGRAGAGGDTQASTQAAADATVTGEGSILGSAPYMSPEQVEGKPVEPTSDIFSLGVLLYEMAVGNRPFQGDSPISTVTSILRDTPRPVSSLRPGLPKELTGIIARCLEKQPERRFRDAGELRDALRNVPRDAGRAGAGSLLRVAAFVVLLAAVALAAYVLWPDRLSPPAGEAPGIAQGTARGPSIAVLPFVNASGDAEQDYFSLGLAESIIAELSRYRDLSVRASFSTAQFKDTDLGIDELGDALNTRYLLQGTLQKAGQRIRVGVQLSDTSDGRLVWGQNYQRDLTAGDLFDLQDELTSQVVNAIAGSYGALVRAELPGARRKPPASLDSYDCVLRAYEYLQVHTAANHLAARDCLEAALQDDPEYADGLAWLGYLYSDAYHHRWNQQFEDQEALDRALEYTEKAVRLDDTNHVTHGALALVHYLRQEHERGKSEALRALELSRNNAMWLALMGNYLIQLADFEAGVPMLLRAIELGPHPPGWVKMGLFLDHYHQEQYEEALAVAHGLEMGDDFRLPMYLVAAYGQLGRLDEAAGPLEELRQMWSLRVKELPLGEIRRELIERHAYSPEVADHLMEGLTKAGADLSTG